MSIDIAGFQSSGRVSETANREINNAAGACVGRRFYTHVPPSEGEVPPAQGSTCWNWVGFQVLSN